MIAAWLAAMITVTPATMPRGWPCAPTHVNSGFGWREADQRTHPGVDLAARPGTAVRATAAGVVSYSGPAGDYGLLVIVAHGPLVETRYAHLSKLWHRAGTRIQVGQRLGSVGSTGRSTGPHLHYEVRINKVPVDPMLFMSEEHD